MLQPVIVWCCEQHLGQICLQAVLQDQSFLEAADWLPAAAQVWAHSIVIATGATARKLGIPSEERFWSAGISACAICDGEQRPEPEVLYEAASVSLHLGRMSPKPGQVGLILAWPAPYTSRHGLQKASAPWEILHCRSRIDPGPRRGLRYLSLRHLTHTQHSLPAALCCASKAGTPATCLCLLQVPATTSGIRSWLWPAVVTPQLKRQCT